MKFTFGFIYFNLTCFALSFSLFNSSKEKTLHIGFFPNLTHPQALVAQALAKEGKENYFPKDYKIEWMRFNAGPTAMEGLLTHVIDLSYVGPSPALNTYLRSKGKEARLLAGAVRGGSGLVVKKELAQKPFQNWNGQKIASPQYGNTQDIACRNWLQSLQTKDAIQILPASNPDQLTLFKKRQIDGAWTIEPWRSRLISEGEGVLVLDDKESWTTILVASNKFCTQHPDLIKLLIQAHHNLTQWIQNNFEETARLIQEELKRQISVVFDQELILQVLKNLQFDTNPKLQDFEKLVDDAIATSLIKKELKLPLDAFFQEVKY